MSNKFNLFLEKMEKAKLSKVAIDTFRAHYMCLSMDEKLLISESQIEPPDNLPKFLDIKEKYRSEQAPKIAIIKLNGGLGTSMGMEQAKSLIDAGNGHTFLELIVRQAELSGNPLYLMESFATYRDCKQYLYRINAPKNVKQFLQNKAPKVMTDTLEPASYPEDPSLEWAPMGHGDIYATMLSTGILREIKQSGVEYLFISNADNLGAIPDPSIPLFMKEGKIGFLMEVAKRTEEDKKGGHLAKNGDGQLILRELAQCPQEELSEFQNIQKHSYFNTNNIWINIAKLEELLAEYRGVLPLPVIKNRKNLNPRDPKTPMVFQLETAMGAAISIFKNSIAMEVPRTRFRPIKTTNDLLLLYSDLYELTDQFVPRRTMPDRALPTIDLDPKFYKNIDQMQDRFPQGIPSLKECNSLKIIGDIVVPADVKFKNSVTLINNSEKQILLETGEYFGEIILD